MDKPCPYIMTFSSAAKVTFSSHLSKLKSRRAPGLGISIPLNRNTSELLKLCSSHSPFVHLISTYNESADNVCTRRSSLNPEWQICQVLSLSDLSKVA